MAEFLTPQEYEAAFLEGRCAYAKHGFGRGLNNPHMSLEGYESLKAQARALGWESGWWAGHTASGS